LGKSDAENEQLRVLALLGTQYFPPFIDDLAEQHRVGQVPPGLAARSSA
jgi:hypothetical protein